MGVRLGSTIGAIGGLLFVVINAGPIGAPAATIVRIVGVVAFCLVLFLIRTRTSGRADGPAPSRAALRTYWMCVAAEVVAIPVGALVLRLLHQSVLTLVWVVFVVGVHFLPFARAFGVRLFAALGVGLVVVAVAGAVAALADGAVAVAWTAVAAGAVLLMFAAAGVLTNRVGRRSMVS